MIIFFFEKIVWHFWRKLKQQIIKWNLIIKCRPTCNIMGNWKQRIYLQFYLKVIHHFNFNFFFCDIISFQRLNLLDNFISAFGILRSEQFDTNCSLITYHFQNRPENDVQFHLSVFVCSSSIFNISSFYWMK